MSETEFDMKLKKEAKTSLQAYKDQSLLRRKFGDAAVKLYNSIDSEKSAAQLISALGISEDKFVEMLEFMNNNAMVSVVQPAPSLSPVPPKPPAKGGQMPGEEESEEKSGEDGTLADSSDEAGQEPEENPDGKIGSSREEKTIKKGISPASSKFESDSPLSPLEKILHDKYGPLGVRIYNLIDGEKTAEEILKETNVSEAKLVEILEFMDEQGIIKLEKPEEKSPVEESEPGEKKRGGFDSEEGGKDEGEKDDAKEDGEPPQEPRFKPMIEEEPEAQPFKAPLPPPKPPAKEDRAKKIQDELEEEVGIVMVDVPEMAKLSMMQRALLFAELSTKFGKGAREIMELVDGKRDFIDLSLASGLSFFDIDAIMAYFGKKGMLSFRQLVREEIKKKYGEDGFAIYKRFGRDGLLLYEMIGKESSLKDIIVKSKIEPDRAIDILVFIHKVLGLDVPIDRDVIYKQLGLKK